MTCKIKTLLLLILAIASVLPAKAEWTRVPDPTEYNQPVDFSKIRFWAGEGENEAAFVFDGVRTTVWGYRWSGETPSVKEIMEAIKEADPRMTELVFEQDDLIALEYSNFMTNDVGVYRKSSSSDSEVLIASSLSPNDYQLCEERYLHKVGNKETVVVSMRSVGSKQANVLVTFNYRPALDETGVFVPDPFIFHHDGNGNATFEPYINLPGKTVDYKIVSATIESLSQDNPLNEYLEATGLRFDETNEAIYTNLPVGEIELQYVVEYTEVADGPDAEAKTLTSAPFKMIVKEPARPLVAMSFEYPNYRFKKGRAVRINQTEGYDMIVTLQPEDFTYGIIKQEVTNQNLFMLLKEDKPRVISIINDHPVIICKPNAEGESDITFTSVHNPEVTTTTHLALGDTWGEGTFQEVTDLSIDEIHMGYKEIWGKIADYVVPEDASIKTMDVKDIENPDLLKFYTSTQDLIAYGAGETYVTFFSTVCNFEKRVKVIVDEPKRYEGDFLDGFFVFNEDWYNHRNASVNFFPYEGEPYYRAFDQMNPGYCLGETGVNGYAWGDNLYMTCLGDKDPGEINQGLKRVIVNASTMQLLETWYSDGVPYDTDKIFSNGTIRAGKYVFKVYKREEKPTEVYDPFADTLVKTIETGNDVQDVVQDSEGNIWLLCANENRGYLQCINPVSLEITRTIEVNEAIGYTSKALWHREPKFFSSPNEQALFFLQGSHIYRCEIGDGEFLCRQIGPSVIAYGGPSIDPVKNRIVILQSGMAGYIARYAENLYFDPVTGDEVGRQKLPEYYWFPSCAIYPKRFKPEITLETIDVPENEPVEIDLGEYMRDLDPADINFNIIPSILDSGDSEVAAVTLDGATRMLTVEPVASGSTTIRLRAMSGGHDVEKDIPVTIGRSSATEVTATTGNVSLNGRRLTFAGLDGVEFTLFTPAGSVAATYRPSGDLYEAILDVTPGVYLLRGSNGIALKLIAR